VIEQLAWPENVRSAPAVQAAEYSEGEAGMFDTLIEQVSADFDPSTYRDDRKDQIASLIAAAEAVEGVVEEKTGVPRVAQKAAAQNDLSAALTAALAAAGAAPKPAKKTAAKKTAAKKTAPVKKTA
jgi:non-homologous end joining protein Ku